MIKIRNVSFATKKAVAGRQLYKCANKPGSKLDKLEHYHCPLWTKVDLNTKGSFDESGFDIDHIEELSVSGNNNITNLQALCKSCHSVKTKTFLRSTSKINNTIMIKDVINNENPFDSENSNVPRFVCDKCNNMCTGAYHDDKGKSFACKYCEKGFTLSSSMYRHTKHTCKIKKANDMNYERTTILRKK